MVFYQSAIGTVHFTNHMLRAYGSLANLALRNNGLKSVATKSTEPMVLKLIIEIHKLTIYPN